MASLQEILEEAGKELNRSADDMKPHLDLLHDNWYDSPAALKGIPVADLAAMGLPWRLAEKLVSKISESAENEAEQKPKGGARPKPSASAAAGTPKADKAAGDARRSPQHIDRVPVDLEGVDRGFPFLRNLKNERNLQHIKKRTGATLIMSGIGSGRNESGTGKESREPLHIEVSAPSEDELNNAMNMAEDLVNKTFEDYEEWLQKDLPPKPPPARRSPRRPSRDKGKGKGKDRDRSRDGGRGKDRDRSPDKGRGKESRRQGDKGRGKESNDRRQDSGSQAASDARLPADAGELTHARMVRLLKLLQRSASFVPAQSVLNRWNDYCDSHNTGENGRSMRDPKQVDMELIISFMLEQLPRAFWKLLVKKLQGQGRDLGVNLMWNHFCDEFAPEMDGQPGKSLRDPGQLDPELLLAFCSSTIEVGGKVGEYAAKIIDDFYFDFGEQPQGRRGDDRDPRANRDHPRDHRDQPRDHRDQPRENRDPPRNNRDRPRDNVEEDHRDSRKGRGGKGTEREEKSRGKGKGDDRDTAPRDTGKGKDGPRMNGTEKAFTDEIYLDIEHLPARFGFQNRLIGREGRNVKHIRDHTGSFVWLSGKGSNRLEAATQEESPKALHMKVTCDDEGGLDRAMKIVNDLVQSVHDDYEQWLDENEADGGKDKGGKANRKGDGKDRKDRDKGKGRGQSDGPRRRADFDDERSERPRKQQRRD